MRELKFRAWDAERGEMLTVDELRLSVVENAHIFVKGRGWLSAGAGTVMQFTGINDKNGKEIYEGDVVRWYVNDVTRVGIVEYLSESGGYDMKNLHDDYHVCNDFLRGEYEVLSNIYEHPSLLNGGN